MYTTILYDKILRILLSLIILNQNCIYVCIALDHKLCLFILFLLLLLSLRGQTSRITREDTVFLFPCNRQHLIYEHLFAVIYFFSYLFFHAKIRVNDNHDLILTAKSSSSGKKPLFPPPRIYTLDEIGRGGSSSTKV